MNEELIQKFREQSMVTRDTEWGENVQFFDYRIFAKLIVEECTSTIEKEMNEAYGARGDGLADAIEMINKHFGVE
jgi:hypothetical protein